MTDATDDQQQAGPQDDAGVPFPLLSYLDGLMADLSGRIPAALAQWDAEAIHQSRVATRRMKAALDLMQPVLGRKGRRKLSRVLRNLRRRLGPLRDADVMIDHLQEIAGEGKHTRFVHWLTTRLSDERDHLRRRSAKRRPPEAVLEKLSAWHPVREYVCDAHEAVDSLLAESLHLQLDAFAEQADRLVGTPVGSGDDSAMPPVVRQDPHELRISGKALRYTLEMAGVQGHDLPGSLPKTFKKMQDALGLWHDYVVLAESAIQAGLDELLAHHEPDLMAESLDLVRDALADATAQLDKFKRLWSEEGEEIARAIRTTFPLTHAKAVVAEDVSESKTDHDPRDSGSHLGPEDAPPTAASDA